MEISEADKKFYEDTQREVYDDIKALRALCKNHNPMTFTQAHYTALKQMLVLLTLVQRKILAYRAADAEAMRKHVADEIARVDNRNMVSRLTVLKRQVDSLKKRLD